MTNDGYISVGFRYQDDLDKLKQAINDLDNNYINKSRTLKVDVNVTNIADISKQISDELSKLSTLPTVNIGIQIDDQQYQALIASIDAIKDKFDSLPTIKVDVTGFDATQFAASLKTLETNLIAVHTAADAAVQSLQNLEQKKGNLGGGGSGGGTQISPDKDEIKNYERYLEIGNQWLKLSNQLQSAYQKVLKTGGSTSTELERIQTLYNEFINGTSPNGGGTIENEFNSLYYSLSQSGTLIDEAKTKVENLFVTAQNGSSSWITRLNQTQDTLKELINTYSTALGAASNGSNAATGFYSDAAYEQTWTEYYNQVNKFATLFSELQAITANNNLDDIANVDPNTVARVSELTSQLQTLYKLLNGDSLKSTNKNGTLISATDVDQVRSYLSTLGTVREFTASTADSTSNITASLADVNGQAQIVSATFDSMNGTYRVLVKNAESSKTVFGEIVATFQRLSGVVVTYLSGQQFARQVVSGAKQAISTVVELDTALTEMRKVSDDSTSSLEELQQSFFDLADTIGTTAADLSEATADFMRIGESAEEAAESATQAAILYNVSEFDSISDASEALVAISQAYTDVSKSDIVDIINELGNNYAIATDELSEGLQTVSSTLSLLGVSLEEASAMVTTANETIQDASKVATGLRTISLRIFATEEGNEELEAMGEELDEFVTSTTATRREIIKNYTAVASNAHEGIDIIDEETGTYRNLYDILLDISQIYEEIQEEDLLYGTNRATALIEVLGGKNRSSIVSALLSNSDTLEAALTSAESSSGSAEEELSKYLDSIEGKLQQLTNKAQEFASNLVTSDLIKSVLDLANDFIDVANSLSEVNTLLGEVDATIPSIVSIVSMFSAIQKGGSTGPVTFLKEVVSTIKSSSDIAGDASAAFSLFGESISTTASKIFNLTNATKLLNVALSTAATFLVSMVIQEVITYFQELAEAEENLRDNLSDFVNDMESATDTLSDYVDEMNSLIETRDSESSTLSEVLDARADLLELQEEMIEVYGDESEVVQAITEAINGESDAVDQLYDTLAKKEYSSLVSELFGENGEQSQSDLDKVIDTMQNGLINDAYSYGIKVDDDDLQSALSEFSELESYSDGISTYFRLSDDFTNNSTLEQQYDLLTNISDTFDDLGYGDIFDDSTFADVLSELSDYYDAYSSFYEMWLMYDEDSPLLQNEEYANAYKDLQTAYEEYTSALISGNEDATNAAIQSYSTVLDTVTALAEANGDTTVAEFLSNLYATLSAEIPSWKFSIALEANTDGLSDQISTAFVRMQSKKSIDVISVSDFTDALNGVSTGNNLQDTMIRSLFETIREEYGLTVDELADYLYELGYLVDDTTYELIQAFSSDEIDSLGDDLTYALQLTQAEIDECDGDFDKLLEKINKIKAANYEAALSTSTITDAVSTLTDQIEPVFESLADAYTSIWDEDAGFSLDIDNSVLEGVRSAFDDLDDDIAEAFDTGVLDDFLTVLADATSSSEDVQDAFNALATEYINASGLIDDLNENTVDYVATQLENIGVTNGEEVALALLAQQEAEAIDAAYEFTGMTSDEIKALGILDGVSTETTYALIQLKITQILCSDNIIDESESIEEVLALAEAAGITIDALTTLAKVQANITALQGELESALANGDSEYASLIYVELDNLESQAADAVDSLNDELSNVGTDIDFDGWTSSFSDAADSTSSDAEDTADNYTDAYEEAKEALQTLRDRDTISEREYLRRLRTLYSQYYADVEEYSEEFFAEQREYLEEYKDYYDSVIEYIIDIYDDAIDKLEDECDDAVDALEKQKDAAHDAYQAQIDAIEDCIDALEAQIDAYDAQIKQLEKQKKAYEDQIEAIEDQIDAYDDMIEELQDQIDAYDDQIEAIEKIQEEYEDEIELLEEKQEALEDVIEEYEDQIDAYEDMIDAYQDQIDAIQDEIDALEDANEERERELALQEALYALEQAKNQKTNLVYSAESGYTYQADDEAIQEAEDALYEAQLDITIAALEKEIDALEDLQDAIQDEIDLIEDQIEAIEAQIEALDDEIEYFQDMIDALDDEIEAIEDLQEELEDQIEAIEDLQDELEDQIELIEDQIDAIEDQIEVIEEYQDALEEQIDAYERQVDDLNEMMDASDDYFDDLIETTEEFYAQQEEELEAWKKEFEELLDIYEEAINLQNLMDLGLTEEDILGMTIEEFAGIASQYTGILADMSSGNAGLQEQLTSLSNVYFPELTGHLTDTNAEFETLSGIDLTNAVNSSQSLRDGLIDAEEAAQLMIAAVGGDASLLVDTEGEAEDLGASGTGASSITSAFAAAKTASDEMSLAATEDFTELSTLEAETAEQFNTDTEEFAAYVSETQTAGLEETNGTFDTIKQSASDTATSIQDDSINPTKESATQALSDVESASDSANADMQGDFDATTKSVDSAISAVKELISELNSIERDITVTIHIVKVGDTSTGETEFTGTVGNAYASGYPGLKRAEENALRSEFGQPELTVYPNGTYELTTEPIISDLPEGTVIFNEDQTERIVKNSGQTGRSFAGGTITELDPSSILLSALRTNFVMPIVESLQSDTFANKIANALANVQTVDMTQEINQTFNITMPNITDSTSADKLMRDLQLISSKKVQYFG